MKIRFLCDEQMLGVIPNPVSAIKAAPEYFKQIKPQVDHNPQNSTVKRCVPFLDALSSGFIIPLWCDVYVFAKQGNLEIHFPENFPLGQSLGSHSELQIARHPLSNRAYGKQPMKWINPWLVETEPGVSCLFTSPLNHLETRFKILDGVVDTDNYYNNVNFPFLWTGGDGEFFLPKGTPLVQVIPFRRESLEINVSAVDTLKRSKVVSVLGTKLKNGYRDEFWSGKKLKPQLESAPEPEPENTASVLQRQGYVKLSNLIEEPEAKRLLSAFRDHLEHSDAQPDPQCPKSQAVYGIPLFDELLERLTPVVSKASGKNLVPTYSYARMYATGERLEKHVDRPACQYSTTLCLGSKGVPWPIFMVRPEEADSVPGSAVFLNAGDAVLYRGMDMVHYREEFKGVWQAQVFLHWVDADGPFADQRYDGRLVLSHHKPATGADVVPFEPKPKPKPTYDIIEVGPDD